MEGIYDFDEADETLTFIPTAVRRALDVAGLKLSLAAWQALDGKVRGLLVQAGACDEVDPSEVALLLASAKPPAEAIAPLRDPDPTSPPPEVGPVEPSVWARLRPLDRYALAKSARKPEKLARARAEILGNA